MTAAEQPTLRLGQLNFLNVRSSLRERCDLLAAHVEREGIQILALQEIVDPVFVAERMAEVGMEHAAFAPPLLVRHDLEPDGVGVVSSHAIISRAEIPFGESLRSGLHCEFLVAGRSVHLLIAHFAWGGDAEAERLMQAEKLDQLARQIVAENHEAVVLLAGDLNCDDESRTARFLRGLDLGLTGASTYWTDAYLVAGATSEWATSEHSKGLLGPTTARRFGITRPEYLPARRLDYILSYGWRYGKVGCPVEFKRFAGPEVDLPLELSDHYGISAEILL